ncbi:hypothetical protein JHD48_07970 [Sulfurimonas sp. SAG-AH-194-I05]|nr:hypothetical protein [Sulfurimonas sp. SAG-AH-194-I05]MDF1875668.1 hypothetical protein [Sulfurimonas sp. SAG-AH-194-I05]
MTQTTQEEIFTYKGATVKVITVFNHKINPTALVEDKDGNIFPVEKNSLRLAS